MIRSLLFVCLLTAATISIANDDPRIVAIEDYVSDYVDMAAFDGVVLIAEGDEIVYEGVFGKADYAADIPMAADSKFRIASLSKQVTQGAIARLIDRDELTLDSLLSEFLPDYPNGGRITIRQLMDHTAGIPHTNRLDWMDMRLTYTLDEIVERLAEEPLLFSPGEGSQYSNGGYALLARIIEIASGISFAEFISEEFGDEFPSIGHESAYEVVPGMADRYSPGPVYGERVFADVYMSVNRIGGGSLYAAPSDVLRFFRSSYTGRLVSPETTAAVFPQPEDGDTQITGRSPGALAQVYLDFEDDLTVVTMSSNAAWPGSFNADVVALWRGEETNLTSFRLSQAALTDADLAAITGNFLETRFGWEASIELDGDSLVMVRNEIRSPFAPTTDGEFHMPIYDWLCAYTDYGMAFTCRQRDPDATIRFNYERR